METAAAFIGALVGAIAGGVVTYLTTRSRMKLELSHLHDRSLFEKRLAHYQKLFHLSRPTAEMWIKVPSRQDLADLRLELHNWYFSPDAGGMFLTIETKARYIDLWHQLAILSRGVGPLSADEAEGLRLKASDLRHLLAADVGAAQPPRLRGARLGFSPPAPDLAHYGGGT